MGSTPISKTAIGVDARYRDELSMVQDLSLIVISQKGPVRCREITREFDYASGRADLVGLGHKATLHAFETKLAKWRKALDQARRNACFAHYCYVALQRHTANSALKARDEFVRFGVGLLIMTGKEARLVIRPRKNVPLLPWLTETALSVLSPAQPNAK